MTQDDAKSTTTGGGVDAHLARHGRVSYLEIPAVNPQRSAAFYGAVFGWNVRGDQDHPSFDDVMGGLIGRWSTDLAISSESGLVPYIYVDGIDRVVGEIAARGGRIVREPYAEGDLWVATFRDPAGNLIGVWQQGPR